MGITGAQALVRCLVEEGVKVIFGIPGGAVLPLYDALLEAPIRHVLVRQEQAAAHAASGYARVVGRPGVCFATSGPGVTNLVTGIATAYMDSIPMVIITGQVATTLIGTDAFQEVDTSGITLPVTKHNYLVKSPDDIPRVVKEAFHLAKTGRPGPVLIDLPKDVSGGECQLNIPAEVELQGYKPNYQGHPAQIRNLAQALKRAERPLLFAGGGVISSNAAEELRALAEKAQVPVVTSLMGIGSIPSGHNLSLGMLGLHGTPCANYTVMNCDLLIGLGVRFDDRVTGSVTKFAPGARIIHVDIDPAEIGKNIRVDVPIVGDLRLVLQELLPLVEKQVHPEWLVQVEAWRRDYPLAYSPAEGVIRPQQVVEELGRLTGGEAIITTDVGQHQMWAAQYNRGVHPRSFISSGGLGTMGYGFPAAIGAQLAAPESTVITISGDGSFQMHMAELGTASEQGLPIKVLIFNNGCLALVRQLQHFYCNRRYSAVDFRCNPDFVRLASCYGAVGLRIERPEEVRPVLEEALNNGQLTIVDCHISPEEVVYPMVPNNKGLDEMLRFPDQGGGQ